MAVNHYHREEDFQLENGDILNGISLTYNSFGKINEEGTNVIWVFHALTANSDVSEWWNPLLGEGRIFDTSKYFVVCANILGSCYGTTGPSSINKSTGLPYGVDFPLITIRDIVNAHQLLKNHLGITKIHLGVGGSMGGQQLLEWSISEPQLFEKICPIATNAKHTPWGIALNTSQRMAIESDTSFSESIDGGQKGLAAARSMAMISYRNYETYNRTQTDEQETLDSHKASSYQRYQGKKLSDRFNAHSYYSLTMTMDSQDVGRKRGGLEEALKKITAQTIIVGISSDILFPLEDQKRINNSIPNSKFVKIESSYGHDGFLIEFKELESILGPLID